MFFGLMEQKLHLFDSLDEFVYWYNYVKPHMSLNFDEPETPHQAFLRKLPAERVFEFGRRWLFEELNYFEILLQSGIQTKYL